MTSTEISKGRVSTLTDEQEHVLKQVWMYILHFSGYTITPPGPLMRRNSVSSIKSSHTTNSEKKEKKKGGLFNKFKKSSKKEESIDHNKLVRTLSNQSAIDPNVKHTTDLKIHSALNSLDPDSALDGFWAAMRHDSPDNLLLRFIRARKWDVDNSLLMIAHTIEWRTKGSNVDSLLKSGELGCFEKKQAGVLKQFQSGKCIIRGKDKKNRPIVIVRPKFHFSSDQTSEEVEIFTLLIIEYARLMLTEPVDQCTLIFDLKGFTMSNMDYDPVKYMIKAFEAHYPESLGILLVHRAPWIFNGIWQIVKNWLDPVVSSKINFTKNLSDLEKYIDRKELIKDLDGSDDHEYNYLEPTESQNGLAIKDESVVNELKMQRQELQKQFIQKTIEWIESKDLVTSKALLNEKIELGKKLGENYIQIDGGIRNRSVYDRFGDITFK